MSDKITDSVTKLKGESNYDVWRQDIQVYFDHKDLDLWPILTGAVTSPIDSPLPTPSNTYVRQRVADNLGVTPDLVTDAEIREWIKEHILDVNDEYVWFRKANADCLHYLSSTLEDHIKPFIRGIRDSAEAFRIICNTYGAVNAHTFQLRWSAWVSCTYKPGGQAGLFLTKWKKALTELLECSKVKLPQSFQYAQFIEAVRSHPSTEQFVTSYKPDLSSPHLIEETFSEFMSAESTRRHYSAMALSSNKDDKDKGKKPQARGPAAASTSAGDSKATEKTDKPNASAVRFDADRYFMSAASAVVRPDPVVETTPSVASAVADPDATQDIWMLDCGATDHMTPYKSAFVTFTPCRVRVSLPDGRDSVTEGYGDIVLNVSNPEVDKVTDITLRKAWYIPKFTHNLMSSSRLFEDSGIESVLGKYGTLRKEGGDPSRNMSNQDIIAFAEKIRGQYWLTTVNGDSQIAKLHASAVTYDKIAISAVREIDANAAAKRTPKPIPMDLAHRRACHAGEQKVSRMPEVSEGITFIKGTGIVRPCPPCIVGKGHSLPFDKDKPITTHPGDRLHTDIWGPISHTALGGYNYFATITDDASRFCWVYLLKHRDEVVDCIKKVIQYLLQQFNYKVKSIVGDNAGEYRAIETFCKHEGITWDPAPPYTPRRNPLAEIKNRWLVEPLVAVLSENQLPKHLWGELLLGVNFTMNRLWHSKIMMTPYEAFYGKKPDVSGLRALGCQAWYHIPKDNRESKLSPHMAEARLVGYTRHGDYRLYDVHSRKIVVSRNVIFNETTVKDLPTPSYDLDDRLGESTPPMDHAAQQRRYVPQEFLNPESMANTNTNDHATSERPQRPYPVVPTPFISADDLPPSERANLPPITSFHRKRQRERIMQHEHDNYNRDVARRHTEMTGARLDLPADDNRFQGLDRIDEASSSSSSESPNDISPDPADNGDEGGTIGNTDVETGPSLRRSTRVKKPSLAGQESQRYLASFAVDIQYEDGADPPYCEFLDRGIHEDLFPRVRPTLSAATAMTPYEPDGWKDAMSCPEADKWKIAIEKELEKQPKNGTWRVVKRPPSSNFKPIPLRWVFKVKHDGTYKARLVAKGFKQRKGRDYLDVYASTAKAASFKLFIAIAAAFGWKLHHIDFISAFLHAELVDQIYIELPEGIREKLPPEMCGLLLKTLYGLKQAPREWGKVVHDAFIALGFRKLEADYSVYALFDAIYRIYFLVHVDDVLIMSPSDDDIAWLKTALIKSFNLTDNGISTHFLGVDIIYGPDGEIYLSQEQYIDKLLTKFGLEDAHSTDTPFFEKEVLQPNEGTANPAEVHEYREKSGSLIWLMVNTRPDIPFPVTKLARYAHNPSNRHFTAIKRVYRYLKGSKRRCIRFKPSPDPLIGFVDADWAGKHADSCLSTSGFIFKLAGGPVSWASKKQTCVALSSTESEYIAASLATQEVLWLHLFIEEMGLADTLLNRPDPTYIYEDNVGAICLTENPEFHQRTKHIDVKYHHIRDHVARGVCKFVQIPTEEQAADGLTKPLQKIQHARFIKLLGMCDVPVPTCKAAYDIAAFKFK